MALRRLFIVMSVSMLLLAACSDDNGSGGASGTTGPSSPTETETSPPPASESPSSGGGGETEVEAEDSSLGTILVDQKGNTLYVFLQDTGDTSTCTGDCAATWPAFDREG